MSFCLPICRSSLLRSFLAPDQGRSADGASCAPRGELRVSAHFKFWLERTPSKGKGLRERSLFFGVICPLRIAVLCVSFGFLNRWILWRLLGRSRRRGDGMRRGGGEGLFPCYFTSTNISRCFTLLVKDGNNRDFFGVVFWGRHFAWINKRCFTSYLSISCPISCPSWLHIRTSFFRC